MPLEKDSHTSSLTPPETCSSSVPRSFFLNSSWPISVREIPTMANSIGSFRCEANS
jgi:hypothetical protein